MSTLYTERLCLRPWVMSDAESLFLLASDPDVGPLTGWAPHKDLAESKQILRTILMTPETYAITDRKTGEVMGSISLLFSESSNMTLGKNEAEIGAWLGKAFWFGGYGTEATEEIVRHAFEDLDLSRVYTQNFKDNGPSVRVQEKLGFEYRSTRENVWWERLGEYKTIERRVRNNPKYEI